MPPNPTPDELSRRISEQEQALRAMEKREARLTDEVAWLRLLFRESRDAIVVLDLKGGVFDANPRFADMLGYSMEEIRTLHVWEWDALETKERILEMIHEVDAAGHHFVTQHRRKDGTIIHVELSNNGATYRGQKLILCICRDITERKRAEREREELIRKLQESLTEIKTLRGILPVCCFCKKVRDDEGYWEQVDVYIKKHLDADVSHSICPECLRKHYPDYYKDCLGKGKDE